MSDIHLESGREFEDDIPEHDVVVLAGDIHKGILGIEWAKEIFTKPVIYVAGNHEHYGTILEQNLINMRKATEGSNVTLLENEEIVINGTHFIGCTLWTDFSLFSRPDDSKNSAQLCIRDFTRIGMDGRGIYPEDMEAMHAKSVQFLETAINDSKAEEIVVITHFGISYNCISPGYAGDRLNPYFSTNLEKLCENLKQDVLWIFGHTHYKNNFVQGKAKVFSNPVGYPGELYFNPEVLDTRKELGLNPAKLKHKNSI